MQRKLSKNLASDRTNTCPSACVLDRVGKAALATRAVFALHNTRALLGATHVATTTNDAVGSC